MSQQRRCFVVQFVRAGKVDHTVCVDGLRRLVWHDEDKYPVERNVDSLRQCCVMRLKKVRLRAMEVFMQVERKEGQGAQMWLSFI